MTLDFETARGAKVFIEPSAIPIVSFSLTFRRGALSDPEGTEGATRATLRMLRRGAGKGAKALSAQTIEETLDFLGSEMSIDVSMTSSSVVGNVLKRNLDPFFDLLETVLFEPTFDEAEFARLKRETLAEMIEARDNDRALAQRAFRKAMYAGHPYARISTEKSVSGLTTDMLRRVHSETIALGDWVLGLSGDVSKADADKLVARLEKRFGTGKSTKAPVADPARPTGRSLLLVDKPERSQSQILIGGLGTHPDDEDHTALVVANAIFGGTFTSRLMREVRSKRGWSYGASCRLGLDRIRQEFAMWTFPSAQDTAACIELELSLLEELVEKGIQEDELSFIKNYLVRSYAFDVDTAPKRLHQRLDIELIGLKDDYFSGYRDRVRAVTLEEANAALRKRIAPEALHIVVVTTNSELGETLRTKIPKLARNEVLPFDSL